LTEIADTLKILKGNNIVWSLQKCKESSIKCAAPPGSAKREARSKQGRKAAHPSCYAEESCPSFLRSEARSEARKAIPSEKQPRFIELC
jgi:hypothetical protein